VPRILTVGGLGVDAAGVCARAAKDKADMEAISHIDKALRRVGKALMRMFEILR
jgi:hypothetical protein